MCLPTPALQCSDWRRWVQNLTHSRTDWQCRFWAVFDSWKGIMFVCVLSKNYLPFIVLIKDIVHNFSLCSNNFLYSLPEPRSKLSFLENNFKYFRMLFIVLLVPVLADMVPMAETTKTEVQTISPKIIQNYCNLLKSTIRYQEVALFIQKYV